MNMFGLVYLSLHKDLRLPTRVGMSNLPTMLHTSKNLTFTARLPLDTYIKLRKSYTFSHQLVVNSIDRVRERETFVNMHLIDLVEHELGPILSWPTQILLILLVHVPDARTVEELSAFFFGNGLPYGLAWRLYKACNHTVK
jgi:hypothetical protein